jgi:DNA-binding MarR family transcriptional regulator
VARGSDVGAVERSLEQLFRLTVNRRMHQRQTEVVGVDVTRAGYAILRCLDDGGELSQGELARLCSMDPGAASRQVRQLEDAGLVERAGADDGRVVVLRATARGRDVYRRIVAVRTGHMTEVLSGWSATDRAALARLVDRLVDDLKAVPFKPVAKEGSSRNAHA